MLQRQETSFKTLDTKIGKGLEFILSHFDTTFLFPRTVSTKTSQNAQLLVVSKVLAIARFKQSNFLDCRVNAYSNYDIPEEDIPINFLFIDLDLSGFKVKEDLDTALGSTLAEIKDRLEGHPTVLWTGNGYHIYLPLEPFWFSNISNFNQYQEVNKKFPRYAAKFLSKDTSDKCNFQSPKSCMLRIPFTLNSKCLESGIDPEVKIIRKWNGKRASIKYLINNFYAHLKNEKLKEEEWKNSVHSNSSYTNSNNACYKWIELLLQTPLEDFRKNAVSLILVPYLITVKKFGIEQTLEQVKLWLNKCDNLRKLDFRIDYKVKSDINYVIRNKRKPLKFANLKTRSPKLYNLLKNKL